MNDLWLAPEQELIRKATSIRQGENLLIQTDKHATLLKYDGARKPVRPHVFETKKSRAWADLLLETDKPQDPGTEVVQELRLQLRSTYRIDFTYDEEFDIHLPRPATDKHHSLTLAHKLGDGSIQNTNQQITVVTEQELVEKHVQKLVRKNYFKNNIKAFLHNKPTSNQVPKNNLLSRITNLVKHQKNKPKYLSFTRRHARKWLENATKDAAHGSFVYIGSPHHVYLMGVAKDQRGNPYLQGTYTTSTKPMLWFSNTYLGPLSVTDMNKPMFEGQATVNVAKYRTQEPPELGGKPFVMSAVGRTQNCKNTIWMAEPQIITTSKKEAIKHFKTTDFAEYADVVEAYANKIHQPTPNARPNGRYFY